MNCMYDVFKQLAGNGLIWVERTTSLAEAEERVASLGLVFASEKYLIYDVREGSLLEPYAR